MVKKETKAKIEKKPAKPKKEIKKTEPSLKKETPEKIVSKKKIEVVSGSESDKQDLITKFATHSGDTGSPEVQVAILTWKIQGLQKHLTENPKDNHSRRGLLKIIAKRRRIMNYLKDKDAKRYSELEKRLSEYQKKA